MNRSFIGNADAFKERSNRRKNTGQLLGGQFFVHITRWKLTDEKKRWCKNHFRSFWGKDQFGNWFPQCVEGHKKNEQCEEGEVD